MRYGSRPLRGYSPLRENGKDLPREYLAGVHGLLDGNRAGAYRGARARRLTTQLRHNNQALGTRYQKRGKN